MVTFTDLSNSSNIALRYGGPGGTFEVRGRTPCEVGEDRCCQRRYRSVYRLIADLDGNLTEELIDDDLLLSNAKEIANRMAASQPLPDMPVEAEIPVTIVDVVLQEEKA